MSTQDASDFTIEDLLQLAGRDRDAASMFMLDEPDSGAIVIVKGGDNVAKVRDSLAEAGLLDPLKRFVDDGEASLPSFIVKEPDLSGPVSYETHDQKTRREVATEIRRAIAKCIVDAERNTELHIERDVYDSHTARAVIQEVREAFSRMDDGLAVMLQEGGVA